MPTVPDDVLVAAAAHLRELADHDAEMFGARLVRWWPDVAEGLRQVYEPDVADEVGVRLGGARGGGVRGTRPGPQAAGPASGCSSPTGSSSPRMLGYAAYAERFAGDLRGVGRAASTTSPSSASRYLHLMPLLQPRAGANDGGYAVADYRTVRADLGTIDDLATLADDAARARHQPVPRPRAQPRRPRARVGRARPRARRPALPALLPRLPRPHHARRATSARCRRSSPTSRPGSFTWDDELDGWVWTTFNAWQWDVDWSNPDVLCEYADIVLFLANLGVEVLRLDAIAFIWKRLGTDCQNQPEVHAHHPGAAGRRPDRLPGRRCSRPRRSSAPRDLVHYLGRGATHGKVSDLAYHNSLMVQLWSMLASRDVRPRGRTRCGRSADVPVDDGVDHLRPLPRRHRLGDRRRRRRGRGPVRAASHRRVPVRLLLRATSRQSPAPRAGLPGQRGDRRPPDQRDGGQPRRPRRASRPPTRPPPRPAVDRILLVARDRPRLGRRAGDLDGRRARRCATTPTGPTTRPRGRQPLGAPAADAVGTRPSAATTGDDRAAGVRRARPPGRGPRRRCRTCTRRSQPSRSTRPIPACWPCCAATRWGRCSGSTTSPTPSARSRRGGWPTSASSRRGASTCSAVRRPTSTRTATYGSAVPRVVADRTAT